MAKPEFTGESYTLQLMQSEIYNKCLVIYLLSAIKVVLLRKIKLMSIQ
jgi:hypothetical protein